MKRGMKNSVSNVRADEFFSPVETIPSTLLSSDDSPIRKKHALVIFVKTQRFIRSRIYFYFGLNPTFFTNHARSCHNYYSQRISAAAIIARKTLVIRQPCIAIRAAVTSSGFAKNILLSRPITTRDRCPLCSGCEMKRSLRFL